MSPSGAPRGIGVVANDIHRRRTRTQAAKDGTAYGIEGHPRDQVKRGGDKVDVLCIRLYGGKQPGGEIRETVLDAPSRPQYHLGCGGRRCHHHVLQEHAACVQESKGYIV